MFEKESKEYANKWLEHVKDLELHHKSDEKPEYIRILEAHQKGAEFGYNKANEWHYVKDGEYPKEYKDILICFLTEDDMKDCVCGWYEYDSDNDKHIFEYLNVLGTQYLETVIAWKENVLPELKESK